MASRVTGTIADLRHVVILMQENRSFDHYYGTLRGVRGFSDQQALRYSDGTTVFAQPDRSRADPAPLLPFPRSPGSSRRASTPSTRRPARATVRTTRGQYWTR
jgi:phospholipase C